MNPYTVTQRGQTYTVNGPNYSHKHSGAGAQTAANREADALNTVYRAGFNAGTTYADQLDEAIDQVEA